MQEPNPHTYAMLRDLYESLPHCRALGLKFEGQEGRAQKMSVDWREDLVGNPQTNVIHGGVITTLIDVTSAIAVAAQLPKLESLATLDMRIDYMHPATPQQRVYCRAECYKLSGQVAFVRSVCFQDSAEEPLVLGMATFMRTPLPAHINPYTGAEQGVAP